ncbi:MAG: mechanosensitive ion channel family protein [Candidatus Babeliales bacterium]
MLDLKEMWASIQETVFNKEVLFTGIKVLLILVLGYIGLKLAIRFARRALEHHGTEHVRTLLLRALYYAGVLIILFLVLHALNFQMGALLGAAGIFTAAIGFASQTSVSNIISGLFLISESSFKIGDYIEVAGVAGTVDSIDLLSVKLRQANGTFVRVPHATIIASNVVNTSYFEERRFDFKIAVSHKEDVRRVCDVIHAVAKANQFSLKDKEPLLFCEEFNESTLKIQVGVWSNQKNWQNLKDTIIAEIQERFAKEHIIMPLPMYVSFEQLEKY